MFLLLGLSCLCSESSAQDPFLDREFGDRVEQLDEGSATPDPEAPPIPTPANERAKKPAPFPGYGAYRAILTDICNLLLAEGHYPRIKEVLDTLGKENADCSPCRQMYRALTCRSASRNAPKVKKVNAPSTELLTAITIFFNLVADAPGLAEPTSKSLEPILKMLAVPQDPTSTAYFEILNAYIRAPLAKLLDAAKEENDKKDSKKKEQKKKKQLESLF